MASLNASTGEASTPGRTPHAVFPRLKLISTRLVRPFPMAERRTKPISRRHTRRRKAATADVIESSVTTQRVSAKWKRHYRNLIQLREQIVNRQNGLVNDARTEQAAFSLHMADAGTDSFDRDFALSRISSEQDAVYEIDQALNRIRNGAYGICELTGEPIEPQRLEAIPWARFSLAAEKKLEKEGVVRPAHFASRTAVSREAGEGNQIRGPAEAESEQ
jgi:DnaK suppressor protein